MDGVTDVRFCIAMGRLGGLGVINLEGVQTRYANPSEVLDQIVKAGKEEVTALSRGSIPSRSRRNSSPNASRN